MLVLFSTFLVSLFVSGSQKYIYATLNEKNLDVMVTDMGVMYQVPEVVDPIDVDDPTKGQNLK